jgi:hypothetical protein
LSFKIQEKLSALALMLEVIYKARGSIVPTLLTIAFYTDISKNMFDRGPKGFKAYQDQLDLHYEVMHYIGTMKTPMVSIMDGIVSKYMLYMYHKPANQDVNCIVL